MLIFYLREGMLFTNLTRGLFFCLVLFSTVSASWALEQAKSLPAQSTTELKKKAEEEIQKVKQTPKKTASEAPSSSYLRLKDPKEQIREQKNTFEVRLGLQTLKIDKQNQFLGQTYEVQPEGRSAALAVSFSALHKQEGLNLAHGPSLEFQIGSSEIDLVTPTKSKVPARLISTSLELGYRLQTRTTDWTWEASPFVARSQSTQASSNSLAQDSGQANLAGLAITAMYDLDAQWGVFATAKSAKILNQSGLDAVPQTNNIQTGFSYLW